MGKQVIIIPEKQILTNRLLPPTTELLQEVMRDNYANFDRLLTLFDKQEIIIEWNYYKDGKSWLGKAQRKKKTVLWISVWENCFKLSFFFTEKTKYGIDTLPIDAVIKRDFSGQQAAGKLIPLILEIRNSSILNDIEQILKYRISCK